MSLAVAVPEAPRGSYREMWLITLGHSLTHWYPATFYLILPIIGKELGLSYSQIGLIMTCQYIAGADLAVGEPQLLADDGQDQVESRRIPVRERVAECDQPHLAVRAEWGFGGGNGDAHFASPRPRYYQFPLRFSTTSSKSFVHLSLSSSERTGSVCRIFTFLRREGALVFEGT